MNVFISWSGDRSNKLANALLQFLSGAFPSLKVWMSEQYIQAGERWGEELSRTLERSDFGVLCLTPENLNAPWLLFEAGSLAKSVARSKVVPYRLGLRSDAMLLPLAQFQGVDADENGTWNLVQSLNSGLDSPVGEPQLSSVFKDRWPLLKSQIEVILASTSPVAASEIDRERERARRFCARVAGAWWERIAGDGIGFFQIQMDELHNSVRLVDGRFYDEGGAQTAHWNSAAARIDEENSKKGIVYLRECRKLTGDAKNFIHGYGDMWFEGSTELFDRANGMFYDFERGEFQKTLAKSVELRRVHDTNEISTMQNGTSSDRKSLVEKMIRTW